MAKGGCLHGQKSVWPSPYLRAGRSFGHEMAKKPAFAGHHKTKSKPGPLWPKGGKAGNREG